MKPTIVKFPKPDNLKSFVEDFMEDYAADQVTDAVFIYRRKVGDTVQTVRHWFGESSSLLCLGLATHMARVIEDYIQEDSE